MTRYLLAVAAVAMVSNQAFAAAKSVTLLGVTGPGGDQIASQLEQELGDLYEVVPGDAYRATADELELPGASADEVKAVATKLRIDAVIGASVTGTGRARQLAIAVREGSTGRTLARGKYELSSPRVLKDRVIADLVRALEMASSMRTGSRGRGGVSDGDSGSSPNTASTSVTRRPRPRERAVAGVSLNVGPSLLTRSLAIEGAGAPAYSAGTLVGLRVSAGLFPFALSVVRRQPSGAGVVWRARLVRVHLPQHGERAGRQLDGPRAARATCASPGASRSGTRRSAAICRSRAATRRSRSRTKRPTWWRAQRELRHRGRGARVGSHARRAVGVCWRCASSPWRPSVPATWSRPKAMAAPAPGASTPAEA